MSVNLPARFEVGRIKQWKFASFVRSTVATLPCLYVVVDWFGVPQGCGSGGVYFAISWQFRPFFFFFSLIPHSTTIIQSFVHTPANQRHSELPNFSTRDHLTNGPSDIDSIFID